MNAYPEHEKMRAVKTESQAIGEFLEWIHEEKGLFLARYEEGANWPSSVNYSTEKILAEHFDIDLSKIEAEKLAMIEEIVRTEGPL